MLQLWQMGSHRQVLQSFQEGHALDALIASFKATDIPVATGDAATDVHSQPLRGTTKQRRTLNALRRTVVESNLADDVLMFNRTCFDALQQQLKVPCSVDACASNDGSNALLSDYCSPENSFFSRSFDGNSSTVLFIHPPRVNRESFLLRYAAAKLKNPKLGACILLPAKHSILSNHMKKK